MDLNNRDYAVKQDKLDPLRELRNDFVFPTKADLARAAVQPSSTKTEDTAPCTYLCGNSLGLQPRLAREYLTQYLDTWATKGVYGHFKEVNDTALPPWLGVDDSLQHDMAAIVGAEDSEVAMMNTLTGNLHLMMCSFYRPTKDRYKIILEGKAFPSDHYAVESQLRNHDLSPDDAMVLIEPPHPSSSSLLPTEHILSIIDQHASTTALLLLPGIQFYTGQRLDIPTITAHARRHGITVGWDLAHAAGNVPLALHAWDVDFAVWCTYKYLNSGPGCMGGCFVHARHGAVTKSSDGTLDYRPRLSGWWGSSKESRFAMTNEFEPIPGAAGFQLSNTSVGDGTAVKASLDVFKRTSIEELRAKSLKLTKYLEEMLNLLAAEQKERMGSACFSIITPREPEERGAQLSVLLTPGLLDSVMETLEEEGVVLDERKPDVIRVAPAPIYNNWSDVFEFVRVFRMACERAVKGKVNGEAGKANGSLMANGGADKKGWSEVK